MPVKTKGKKLTPQQIRKKEVKLVVKANQLVEAKYMFDIWEMRLFLSLVAMIRPSDEDDKVYRIWYKDVKTTFQIQSNQTYNFLRDAAKKLFEKSLTVGYMKDGFEREQKYHLIRSVDYLKESEKFAFSQEYIDVRIDNEIKPYLLDIRKRFDASKDRYTSYELRNVINLQTYGIRIYELLKQYEKIGHRTLEVEVLKDTFNITDEYKRFSNFFQKVIKKSIIDINSNTDLTIPIDKIEKIKKGRKVYALRFIILSKSAQELSTLRNEKEPIEQTLFAKNVEQIKQVDEIHQQSLLLFDEFEDVVVGSFGVTPASFLKLLQTGNYPKAAIEQAISVTRRAKYNQEIKKNIAGYFLRALQEGYTDPKEEAKKKKKEKAEQNKKDALQKKLERIKAQKVKAINEKIREVVAEFPNITSEAIISIKDSMMAKLMIEKKELILGRALAIEDYRKDKMLRELVKGKIIDLKNEYFSQLIQDFDQQIDQLNTALLEIQ